MKEQRSFAESGRISPETKTQQSTNAWMGLSNRQTSSSSASVPTAAMPREAGSFGLYLTKGIPRNPQFLQLGVKATGSYHWCRSRWLHRSRRGG